MREVGNGPGQGRDSAELEAREGARARVGRGPGGLRYGDRVGRGGGERGVGLGVAEDVGRVGAEGGGAGLGVDGAGEERAGVRGEREDVFFFEVLEEAVEVWELLAAAREVGTLRGGGD